MNSHPHSTPRVSIVHNGIIENYGALKERLIAKGYTFASADISLIPQTYVKLTSEEDIKNMEKLLDMLEDNEDVQNTYHNWETED